MREAGFTLTEALVSLVLGAVVLAAVLSGVKVAVHGAAQAKAVALDAEAHARAGTILAGDGAHAVWLGDDQGRPWFLGRTDVVQLAGLPRPFAPHDATRGPVAVIYQLVPGAQGTILTRAEAALFGLRMGPAGPVAPIWQGTGRLEFRFLDAAGRWLPAWTDPVRLPRAFALADAADDQPGLVAALPELLPLACAQGPGPACPLPAEAFP